MKAGTLAGLLVSVCLPVSDLVSAPAGRIAILLGAGTAGSLLMLLAGERRGRAAGPAADGAAFSIASAVGSFLGSRGHPGFDLALGEAWLALTFGRPGLLLPGSGAMSALWARDSRAIVFSLASNSGLLVLLSLGFGEGGFLIWFCSFVPLLTATLIVSRRKAAAAARASAPRLVAGADRSMLIWEGGSLCGLEISEEGSVAVLRAESLLSCPQGPETLGVLEEALFRSGYRALLVTGAGPDLVRALEEDGYARRGMGWHRILAAPRR